jgi:hypothetical protein
MFYVHFSLPQIVETDDPFKLAVTLNNVSLDGFPS